MKPILSLFLLFSFNIQAQNCDWSEYVLLNEVNAGSSQQIIDCSVEDKSVKADPLSKLNDLVNAYIDSDVKQSSLIEERVINAGGSSFHLFSHGKSGELLIEGQWKNAKQIVHWFEKNKILQNEKQLNIYGCEFAKGAKGKAAVTFLEESLDISVAASDDITGFDGNWDLEVGDSQASIMIENYHFNLQACTNPTEIGGLVFNDFNNDGIQLNEVGIAGISVSLFDDNGQVGSSQLTNSVGEYLFTGLMAGQNYRIEITVPAGYEEGLVGTDSKTSIQFSQPGNCGNDLGIFELGCYYAENPDLITPCYVYGPNDGTYSGSEAIVKFPESADGHDFIGQTKTANYEATSIATHNEVGAVYGVAWQPKREVYYTSAFHKRYVGFGSAGPDAIYQLDLNGNLIGTIELDNLLAATNTTGGDVHDFSLINGEIYDLGTGDISFDAVGKRGFGDIEIDDYGTTLYAVNLFDRTIYALDVSSGNTANVTILNSWPAPDATGAGRHRPFGLAFHEGKLWVGSVDENSSNAYVHSLDLSGTAFNLELTVPLGFERQSAVGNSGSMVSGSAEWRPWATNTNINYSASGDNDIVYPQPILSDIEFSDTGDMILGFRDRFGDQAGSATYFALSDTEFSWGASAGDLLKACLVNGTYLLETGDTGGCSTTLPRRGNSGPGGKEFYHWDLFQLPTLNLWNPNQNQDGAFHWEATQGALLQLKGKDYIITTQMDPFNDFSGGIVKHNNETGQRVGVDGTNTSTLADLTGGYTLYESGDHNANDGNPVADEGNFGKANGLGDIEAASPPPDIEIGSYLWLDLDEDGIQDPSESPMANVTLNLLDANGNIIGTTTTDSNGEYYFNINNVIQNGRPGLEYYSDYTVQIPNATGASQQSALSSYELTTVDAFTSDDIDSDAIINGTSVEVAVSTDDINGADHSFDIGFRQLNYDVALTKTVDLAAVSLGSSVVFTITVENLADAVTGATVNDVLPAGLTYVSDSPSTGTYDGTNWIIGNMAVGATETIMITATADAEGVTTNTAVVSVDETENGAGAGDALINNVDNACVSVPIQVCENAAISEDLVGEPVVGVYQWFKDGIAIAGATSRIYTATESGNYTYTVDGVGVVGCTITVEQIFCCEPNRCVPITATKN